MIRRLFSLIFIVLAIFFVSHLEYRGRPVHQYFRDFLNQPVIQKTLEKVKTLVMAYLEKDVGDQSNGKSLQHITEDDRRELEKLLKQELEKARR